MENVLAILGSNGGGMSVLPGVDWCFQSRRANLQGTRLRVVVESKRPFEILRSKKTTTFIPSPCCY